MEYASRTELMDMLKRISLPDEAALQALDYPLTHEYVCEQYALIKRDTRAFLKGIEAALDAPQRFLALYCAFLPLCLRDYEAAGVPRSVFDDTFCDIARWEAEYNARTGLHGLTESAWLSMHVCMRLFALGELQFEPSDGEYELTPPDMRGLRQFNVHIPKGAHLELRERSYQMLLDFFGIDRAAVFCHSWLLSPALCKLLPNSSRILAFQREFSILKTYDTNRQAEERIFGDIIDQPERYPAGTSLQAAARAMLMRGELIPAALGVRLVARG